MEQIREDDEPGPPVSQFGEFGGSQPGGDSGKSASEWDQQQ